MTMTAVAKRGIDMKHYPIEKYFDKDGIIGDYWPPGSKDELGRDVGPNGWVDGGDSCQRIGMYYLGLYYMNAFYNRNYPYNQPMDALNALDTLMCKPGNFKRHPDPDFWYSKCNVMSRDQLTPVLAYMATLKNKKRLTGFFLGHLKRGLLFTTNSRRNGSTPENHGEIFKYVDGKPVRRNYDWKLPDFTGPSMWAMYIRGFNLWYLYPLLCILDLEFLINSILKRTAKKDDNDIVNHIVEAALSHIKYRTPVSWIANKFINNGDDMIARMRRYFSGSKDPYFIGELYEPIVKDVMG